MLSQGSPKFSGEQEGNKFPSYNSKFVSNMMAAGLGFEPRLTDSESAVLPLDDLAMFEIKTKNTYLPTGRKNEKFTDIR